MGNIIWAPSCQNELYHHGVKGQKWGVRKNREQSFKRAERSIDRAKKFSSKRMDSFTRLGGFFAKKRFGGLIKANDIKAGRNWLHDENIRQNQLLCRPLINKII